MQAAQVLRTPVIKQQVYVNVGTLMLAQEIRLRVRVEYAVGLFTLVGLFTSRCYRAYIQSIYSLIISSPLNIFVF